MRRFGIGIAVLVCILLLIPVAVMAQDKIVELVFSADGSKFTVQDTIESVASVTMELNGTQYMVSVPIKIEVDATIPLSNSLTTIENGQRVGQYAINILSAEESDKDIDVVMPSLFGGNEEKEFEPAEGKKIVILRLLVANVGDKPLTLSSYTIQGVDDAGRLFEESEMGCVEMQPGESTECVVVFEVEQESHISALDIEVPDHQQLAVP